MAQPNQQAVDYQSKKLLIMGDGGAGKTTFVNRFVNSHHTGNTTSFKRKRVDADDNLKRQDPSSRVDVYQLDFVTKDFITDKEEKIRFNCWDTAGGLREGYFNGTDGAIIMFDVTKRSTYNNATTLIRKIRRLYGNIPIVLCGNKVDLLNKHRHVNVAPFGEWLDWNTKYCEICAISNYNLERPFLLLAWMLVSLAISFRQTPTLIPTKFMIDLKAQDRNEQEIFSALYRANDQALRKRILMPLIVRMLNEDRNQAPDAPLPDDDDELVSKMKWMLNMMMMDW